MSVTTPLSSCHSFDGHAIDPEEGDEAEKSHAEDDANDDAGAYIRILAGIVGELSFDHTSLFYYCRSDVPQCETGVPLAIGAISVEPRC